MRIFVAIDLDPGLKAAVAEFIRTLRRREAAVKWIDPEGMHLTLKFLGETALDVVPAVEEEIRRAASLSRPFPLVLEGTGCFPSERRPRVLWIGIQDHPELSKLQSSLEEGLARIGFPSEKRPFHAHLTIGRIKRPAGLDRVVSILNKAQQTRFGEMTAEKVTLFQSTLRPEGAQYTVVTECGLP